MGPRQIYRTDEMQDAFLSLELVQESLQRVVEDVRYWKWVVIAIHSALQGFMVLALKGTKSMSVWMDKHQEAWWKSYEAGKPYKGNIKLKFFMELYEDIKSEGRMHVSHNSLHFKPEDRHDESLEKLHDLRNEFVHFTPKSWLIYVDGFPEMVEDVLDIIHFLVWDSNNVFWEVGSTPLTNEQFAKELIVHIRELNNEVKRAYSSN